MLPPELLEILACPKCHQKVEPTPDGSALDCRACKLRYQVVDGIPVMLIEEAEPL
ncbi:MAG: Trm112 family protein [Candidatus Dormibacteraceae bacterium]